jgi:hypothetical protein
MSTRPRLSKIRLNLHRDLDSRLRRREGEGEVRSPVCGHEDMRPPHFAARRIDHRDGIAHTVDEQLVPATWVCRRLEVTPPRRVQLAEPRSWKDRLAAEYADVRSDRYAPQLLTSLKLQSSPHWHDKFCAKNVKSQLVRD